MYQSWCAKLRNRLLFVILMMLNTDQIVKAGIWQAVAQKLGSFLCRKPPEVAPAVCAVGSSGAAAAEHCRLLGSQLTQCHQFVVGPAPSACLSQCSEVLGAWRKAGTVLLLHHRWCQAGCYLHGVDKVPAARALGFGSCPEAVMSSECKWWA